ncbi:hypothetical protein CBR_g19086 [Chara braunii]|uniref:Uncharacterized protein n=1 Tax=Chara braunii TaxID=69332 RepID=A0A388KX94_CHABU|nr:hypothetical protein CBR_g19086 [Chara braunii]|eukprot:GBG74679.1 hypothetical protein CBR_g19086 [Chara braunii]
MAARGLYWYAQEYCNLYRPPKKGGAIDHITAAPLPIAEDLGSGCGEVTGAVAHGFSERCEEDEISDDEVELLLIQGWRTDTEGDFLGILFREVRDGHQDSIMDELLIFLTQVLDDMPLEILSRCDKKSGTTTLARTLEPHLLWSTCTELDEGSCYLPSKGAYLSVDVTDLSTWDPLIRRAPIGGTSEEEGDEEEETEVEEDREDDLNYRGSEDSGSEGSKSEEESGSDESSDPAELTREEEEDVARRKREKAEGKRSIEESQESSPQLLQGDPARNPEPPREEDERDGGAAAKLCDTRGLGRCGRDSRPMRPSPRSGF